MLRKILETAFIIGGVCLALYPVLGETLNTGQWIMIGVGCALILVGVVSQFLKKELTYLEKKAIIEHRKEYLPRLRELIKKRLSDTDRLATEASKLSLADYRDKYLMNAWQYKLCHWHFRKDEDQAILSALSSTTFFTNNLYYASLKENDSLFSELTSQYRVVYAENKDRKLAKLLKTLWKFERFVNSIQIFALLSKNNPKIRNSPMGLRIGIRGQESGYEVVDAHFNKVLARIDELENGEDL